MYFEAIEDMANITDRTIADDKKQTTITTIDDMILSFVMAHGLG